MDALNLFPSRIYRFSFPRVDREALRDDAVAWRRADPKGNPRSTGGNGWHSKTDAFTRPAYKALAQEVVAAASEVLRSENHQGVHRVRLTEMWLNWNDTGGYNRPHSHGNGWYSGVFHVDAHEGAPPITFLSPFPGARPDTHSFKPVAGQCIMFPASLVHHVEPHPGPAPRLSVSFNVGLVQPPQTPEQRSFVEVPQLLSRDEVIRVYTQLAGHKWGKGLVGDGRGNDIASSIRINKVLFVDGKKAGSKWRWLYDKIVHHAEIVNGETFKVDISGGGAIQFARYGPGGRYDEHVDRGSATRGAASRTLSCSIILRPAERGGGISFPRSPDQPEHQSPGDAVFFSATEPHAALPVKEGVRDSLILWMSEKPG